MNSLNVVVLDDCEDLRSLVATMLKAKIGVGTLGLSSLAEFEANADAVLATTVAILDVNLGPDQPDGLDAFHWLMSRRYKGYILFLTGHARTHPVLTDLRMSGFAEVLEKPVTSDWLCTLVDQALNDWRFSQYQGRRYGPDWHRRQID